MSNPNPLSPELLIYSPDITPRLQYIARWLEAAQLGMTVALTADATVWRTHNGPRLNYSATPLEEGELRIVPQGLLQQEDIRPQALAVQRWKQSTVLFYNQPGAAIPFDLLAAAFYLLSRYEEYLPHQKDRHGRYDAAQSAAMQFAFLQEPVIDQWVLQLRKIIERHFGSALPAPAFQFRPTYDVDIAWKYRHTGTKRYWGGLAKDLLRLQWPGAVRRLWTGAGWGRDPYDCFDWLDRLHEHYGLRPLYFFLLGSGSKYDRNISPAQPAMQELIRRISGKYATGLHPSYSSYKDAAVLAAEKERLTVLSGRPVTRSRQHYIRFELPHTYHSLLAAGITEDYSMGYASANGFRAGTSRPFAWYDLDAGTATGLQVHPFAFMEATARFYHKHSPEEAWQEWERLWHAVQQVSGTFISIGHNHLLSPAANKAWAQWYRKVLAHAQA